MAEAQRYVVVGGGIIGLAVADRILSDDPSARVSVLEKETRWAAHQTGRNSGVVHSGLYYAPGSHKAVMCRAGAESMFRFADAHGVEVERCGKLVVATDESQVPGLRRLYDRGQQNGLKVRELDPGEARELEPHVSAVAALHVPETGIIDYLGVCTALVRRLSAAGAELRLGTRVVGLEHRATATTVQATTGDLDADAVVNCAGLYSDRVAALGGRRPAARIVPFRGEYYELAPSSRHLVRGPGLPGARPRLPVPGRAPDPDDRRRRARRPERRARPGPGGLPVGDRAAR